LGKNLFDCSSSALCEKEKIVMPNLLINLLLGLSVGAAFGFASQRGKL
jgi:hypothetical protein